MAWKFFFQIVKMRSKIGKNHLQVSNVGSHRCQFVTQNFVRMFFGLGFCCFLNMDFFCIITWNLLKRKFFTILLFHLVLKTFDIPKCRYVTICKAKISFFAIFTIMGFFSGEWQKLGGGEKFIKSSKNVWKCSPTNLL